MSAVIKALASSALILGWSAVAYAESDRDWGMDVQIERAHQTFENDSANVTTVDFAPHFQYGSWDFSLDAPWISADANYVNNRFPSRLVTACDKANSLAQQYPRVRRFADAAARCQNRGVLQSDDTVSGMSDVTAFARYGLSLDDEGIWFLSAGVGYKFDNGDADKNLGSDTRNTLFEVGIGANYGRLNASITGGYVLVDGGDEFTESSYSYASLDVGVDIVKWLTVGCSVDRDQSYYIGADDVTKVTAYMKFKPWEHVRFKVYARDFGNTDGYPDREYGGSLSLVY